MIAISFPASAVDIGGEYEKKIKAAQDIGVLGSDLAGDRINFYTGSTQFTATDVSVPGNNGLSVAIGRRFEVEADHNLAEVQNGLDDPITSAVQRAFGDWDLDIPYLTGVFSQQDGWNIDTTSPQSRCSVIGQTKADGSQATGAPKVLDGIQKGGMQNYTFLPDEYWHGNTLHLPGGDQSMLVASIPNTNRPSSGGPYHWVTNQNWWFSCLPSTANADGGEGFLATAPDGTQYYFDWMSKRNIAKVSLDEDLWPASIRILKFFGFRAEYFLLPSKIVDRFGNWVQYNWSADAFARLLSITSSDGRTINLSYNASGFVSSITDGVRTWQYTYSNGSLVQVTLPDSSTWQYSFANLDTLTINPHHTTDPPCDPTTSPPAACYGLPTMDLGGTPTAYVIHPSGARVDFTFGLHHQAAELEPIYPLGLIQKTISGPGLSNATWRYGFAPSFTEAKDACAAGNCPDMVWTDEIGPDDSVTRRLYGINGIDASQIQGELRGQMNTTTTGGEESPCNSMHAIINDLCGIPSPIVTSTVPVFLQQIDYVHATVVDASNFIFKLGANPLNSNAVLNAQTAVSERAIPQKQRKTTVQGTTFTWQVNVFDNFGNVANVTRSSSLGFSRCEATTYHYNTARWVIGQVALVNDCGTGKAISQTTYDATTALPIATYSFGLLQQSLTYNPDGTLATVTDALNHTIGLSNWKRGIPQLISYPNGTTESATVNTVGWLTEVKDELGNSTGYDYDAMGRLAQITPPGGDPITWNPTVRSFVSVGASEYGLPAGHWKQSVSTGNGRTTTFYDAQWRPVLMLTEDMADASTRSFVVHRYDTLGRGIFTSYPVSTLSTVNDALQGNRTSYDALGRVVRTEQDAENGVLATTTEYLSGYQMRVTNPRGFQTTTSYQVFDAPNYDAPVNIAAPEGVTTAISRDVFGKPLQITRSGPSG